MSVTSSDTEKLMLDFAKNLYNETSKFVIKLQKMSDDSDLGFIESSVMVATVMSEIVAPSGVWTRTQDDLVKLVVEAGKSAADGAMLQNHNRYLEPAKEGTEDKDDVNESVSRSDEALRSKKRLTR